MNTANQVIAPAGEAFIASVLSHDFASALALATPDARFEIVPLGVVGSLASEGKSFFADLSAAFPDLSLMLTQQFTTSDGSTCARLRIEGTQAGDFRGLVNQEKHMDLEGGWLIRAEAGKVTSVRLFWCQNMLYRRFAVKRNDQITITA